MRAIYKYPLHHYKIDYNSLISLNLPKGYQILKLDVQYETPNLWCIVETENEIEQVIFRIVLTGEEIPPECKRETYVDTYILNNSFVGHLFKTK